MIANKEPCLDSDMLADLLAGRLPPADQHGEVTCQGAQRGGRPGTFLASPEASPSMGRHDLPSGFNDEQLRAFMKAILADVHALERMVEEDRFETGIRRIGAEQEMFLLDRSGRAWCGADAMMQKLAHPQFTYELAQFNLECNLHPQVYGGKCLSTMEAELQGLVQKARAAARDLVVA